MGSNGGELSNRSHFMARKARRLGKRKLQRRRNAFEITDSGVSHENFRMAVSLVQPMMQKRERHDPEDRPN
jgi:hypothetical protein